MAFLACRMLLLLVAFAVLAVAFYFVLRGPNFRGSSDRSVNGSDEKPSAHKKLVAEVFEYATSDENDIGDGNEAHEIQRQPVLILYATESGFAAQVARHVASSLASAVPPDADAGHSIPNGHMNGEGKEEEEQEHGEMDVRLRFIPRVLNVSHYRVVDFTRERFVALICSTTGDGVPPNEAAEFRTALESTDVVLPDTSRFAVLALGDRSYPHFCRAGAIFDALLPSGCRLLPRVDVDQEEWPTIEDWTSSFRNAITVAFRTTSMPRGTPVSDMTASGIGVNPPDDYLRAAIDKYAAMLTSESLKYSRSNPFLARLISRRNLTAPAMKAGHKEVVRIELDVSGAHFNYTVGDALAIIPNNNSVLVNRVLRALASNGDEIIHMPDRTHRLSLETALTTSLDITTPRPALLVLLARFSGSGAEVGLASRVLGYDPRDPTRSVASPPASISGGFGGQYLASRDVVDVLHDFPTASITGQQLVDVLGPLHARFYSISSTPKTSPDRIALTVDVLRYSTLGIDREGVASSFLQDRCRLNESPVPVFLSSNPSFRLPLDDSVPIIMIGPGTGVAPFIGFIEERVVTKATGCNWLFFGCRFHDQDFLYREKIKKWAEDGVLHLRTAFSRDSPEKVYVQHRMHECSHRLWSLIDGEGAHIYVCGDGSHMAGDVDKALQEIIAEHGERSVANAAQYLEELYIAKRYQKDVWVT